jgi:serine/threonine protein kinase
VTVVKPSGLPVQPVKNGEVSGRPFREVKGTSLFMSPLVIKNHPKAAINELIQACASQTMSDLKPGKGYDPMVADWWSFGVMFLSMAQGSYPFPPRAESAQHILLDDILRSRYQAPANDEVNELVTLLLGEQKDFMRIMGKNPMCVLGKHPKGIARNSEENAESVFRALVAMPFFNHPERWAVICNLKPKYPTFSKILNYFGKTCPSM